MEKDPYLQKNGVLRNILGITNLVILEKAEADYTSLRLKELHCKSLEGQFDLTHFCEYHKYIFQDLYDWAGSFRKIDIEKAEPALGGLSVEYAPHSKIDSSLELSLNLLNSIDLSVTKEKLAITLSEVISKIWVVHPFRDGNTRTVVAFLYDYLCKNNVEFNIDIVSNNSRYFRTALAASIGIDDKFDSSYLEKIIYDCL